MIVLFLTMAGPVLLGSALGIGVVAGEVEHGTAAMWWAVARSRRRWPWLRTWPIAARPLRHAMHIDVSVAREHVEARLAAALAAGWPHGRRLQRAGVLDPGGPSRQPRVHLRVPDGFTQPPPDD